MELLNGVVAYRWVKNDHLTALHPPDRKFKIAANSQVVVVPRFTARCQWSHHRRPGSASGPGGVFTLGELDCPPGLFPKYLRELCLDRSRSHLQRPS